MILPTGAFAEQTKYIRNTSGGKVNVRRGPGKGWTVDAQLSPGTKVTVISRDGKWSEINSPVYGYVLSEYLSSNPPKSTSTDSKSTAKSGTTRYIKSSDGKKVNARTGPSEKGYGVATQLEPGTRVTLLSSENGWSAIEVNGFTVYVMSKFLTSTAPGTGTTKESSESKKSSFSSFAAEIKSANDKKVNMRVSPNQKSERIAQLEPGTSIEVIGASGSWYKVSYLGATGYIMKKYVKKK